jgi:hypothetical protein
MPTGRSDRRITKEVAVELARPDDPQLKETAIAQNVSARGMRIATEDGWLPGDPVLLSSPESGLRGVYDAQARGPNRKFRTLAELGCNATFVPEQTVPLRREVFGLQSMN